MSLLIRGSDDERELFVYHVNEDGEEMLCGVVANTSEGRLKVWDYIEEAFDTETCSWCLNEVPDSELEEVDDGARICRDCQKTDEGHLRLERTEDEMLTHLDEEHGLDPNTVEGDLQSIHEREHGGD